MNKNNLFLVLFVGIFIVGIVAYFLMNRSIGSDLDSTDPVKILDEMASGERSLRNLMTISSNIVCTFNDTESGVEGEIYVGNGNLRGDFVTQTNGSAMNSHMISTNDRVYVWSDESDQGMVFTLEDVEDPDAEDEMSSSVDLDEEYSYNCRPWIVDRSVFQLPGNIEFIDFSSMMQFEIMTGDGDQVIQGTSEQCAACEALSGDSKTACLQALGC